MKSNNQKRKEAAIKEEERIEFWEETLNNNPLSRLATIQLELHTKTANNIARNIITGLTSKQRKKKGIK